MGKNLDSLFQGNMCSYKSSLSKNWKHSIQMSDDQVMAKTQSWGLKTEQENCVNIAPL